MNPHFELADPLALRDLQVYLGRAARVEEGSARLVASGGVLAVYTAVLYPSGLLDETPTVLGLRTFALAEPAEFDAVVPLRSLLSRVDRVAAEAAATGPVSVSLPLEVQTVTWAGISPPRGGWTEQATVESALLERAAQAGIAEVAAALPGQTGVQLVQRVRSEVWSRPIEGLEYVPAGAAFAGLSLGFLGDDAITVLETGTWTRLTTDRGHVLVKRRAWSLVR